MMRKVYSLLILAGMASMWGCHAGGSGDSGSATAGPNTPASTAAADRAATDDTDAEVARKPVPANDKRPVLVCFGDSLTAGAGTGAGQSYPDYLQADLDQLHYHYRVDNQGVSGNTTKDG